MSDVYLLDELRSAPQTPHDLASARVDAGADITNDTQTLRSIWWSHRRLGASYPPETNVILIRGDKA